MEELRVEALQHYNNSSTQVKNLAVKFFNHMDSDADSSISVAEFAAFIKGNRFLSRLLLNHQELFASLDRNGNGDLDFNEFITFFYVVFASFNCDGCGQQLKGQRHLTCTTCFSQGSDTFDLCSTCFSSLNFAHQHTEFLYLETLMFESIASDDHDSSNKDKEPEDDEDIRSFRKRDIAFEALKVITREVVEHTEFEYLKTLMFESIASDDQDSSDEDKEPEDEEDIRSFRKRDIAFEALKVITREVVEHTGCSIM